MRISKREARVSPSWPWVVSGAVRPPVQATFPLERAADAHRALEAGEMAKLEDNKLVPGMPVQAFIGTGDRTPMAYLLKPFTDYFRMSMREN